MMKVRKLFPGILLVLFLAITAPALAQDRMSTLRQGREALFSPAPRFALNAGSSFGMSGVFSHQLSPSLHWDLSEWFQLEVGTVFSVSRWNQMPHLFPYSPQLPGGEQMLSNGGGQLQGTTVYAFGSYQVSPRLSLRGGSWMERLDMDPGIQSMNQMAFENNPRGILFGFDYHISERIRFGADISLSSGASPLYPGMYHASPFSGGFLNPLPFYRQGRW